MPKPLSYNATLVGRQDCTPELAVFRIKYDEPLDAKTAAFVPGQYVALGLNNEDKPELGSVRRSMSLASAPEQTESFEFYIRYVNHPESANPLTHLLWKRQVDDRIFMTRKPVGKFTLPHTIGDDDDRIRLLVAAGTGLAPFVSMVRSYHLRDSKADMSKIAILHGASYPSHLGYREELMSYAEQHGLHYYSTISRPKEAPDWDGHTGRVEDFFLPDRLAELEERLGLSAGELRPDRVGVLICGLQGTIALTITRLASRGFIPDNRKIRAALEVPADERASVWWEQYDNTPVIDIDDAETVATLRRDLHEGLLRR